MDQTVIVPVPCHTFEASRRAAFHIAVPITVILMFSHSVEGRSGQTLGLRLTANNFVRVTGPIVFGAVGSAFGLPAVFWIVAAIMVSGGLLSRPRAGKR